MSVLVKDMKMPHNCFECKIKAWESGCWIRYRLFEKNIERAKNSN